MKNFSFSKTQLLILIFFPFFCCACEEILSELNSNSLISETVDPAIDNIVKEEMALQEIVGLAVGVVDNGKVIHLKGYGYRDKEKKWEVDLNTRFRWASVSKPITAVAAMKLWEDQKLDLQEDISEKYLPGYPKTGVTMHHLLSNTSGIPHHKDVDLDNSINYPEESSWNADMAVKLFEDDTLLFNPGDDYLYSTYGFILAGAVVESITQKEYNQSFVQYVQKHIADAGGMNSFTEDYKGLNLPWRSGHYTKTCSNVIQDLTRIDVSWRLPGGGFVSNIKDATLFMKGMLDDKFVSETTKNEMYKSQSTGGEYGYGFFRSSLGGSSLIQHGGNQRGTANLLGFFPAEEKGIVLFCNADYYSRSRIFRRIANIMGIPQNASDYNLFNALGCNNEDECQGNTDDTFAGVWTPGTAETLIRRGYASDEFLELRDQLHAFGYTLVDFEPYRKGNQVLWDGIFRKENRGIITARNYTQDGFLEKYQEHVANGYRLVDLETHEDNNGNWRWSGIFNKKSGRHAIWRNYDTEGFNQKWQEMADQGLRLIDMETYLGKDGKRLWAGVWEEGTYDYKLNRNYTTAEFGTMRNTYKSQGYQLVDIETYTGAQGQRLWAGVWKKTNNDEKLWRNWGWCDLLERHNQAVEEGYQLTDLEVY